VNEPHETEIKIPVSDLAPCRAILVSSGAALNRLKTLSSTDTSG